ncbi:MAG TPA: hypothetical protein DCM87_05275 [Planctomycetes bacterium]|nr:hypothetical protein [Planctomycetota bacterium]
MRSKLCVLLSLAFVLPACGSREDPAAKNAVGPAAQAAGMDVTKPYLTEKKIQGVIAIIKEKPEFWDSCKGLTPVTVNAEMEAVAKKYGFANFQDLSASTYRVSIGMMQAQIAKHASEMEAAQEGMDEDADTPPEVKKMMQDQMKAAMSMGQDLNDADQKLVEKYLGQLEALHE